MTRDDRIAALLKAAGELTFCLGAANLGGQYARLAMVLDAAAEKVKAAQSESERIWRDGGSPPNDPDQSVLVYAKDFGFGIDCYRFGPDGDAWESFGEDVLFWMPLPKEPA